MCTKKPRIGQFLSYKQYDTMEKQKMQHFSTVLLRILCKKAYICLKVSNVYKTKQKAETPKVYTTRLTKSALFVIL